MGGLSTARSGLRLCAKGAILIFLLQAAAGPVEAGLAAQAGIGAVHPSFGLRGRNTEFVFKGQGLNAPVVCAVFYRHSTYEHLIQGAFINQTAVSCVIEGLGMFADVEVRWGKVDWGSPVRQRDLLRIPFVVEPTIARVDPTTVPACGPLAFSLHLDNSDELAALAKEMGVDPNEMLQPSPLALITPRRRHGRSSQGADIRKAAAGAARLNLSDPATWPLQRPWMQSSFAVRGWALPSGSRLDFQTARSTRLMEEEYQVEVTLDGQHVLQASKPLPGMLPKGQLLHLAPPTVAILEDMVLIAAAPGSSATLRVALQGPERQLGWTSHRPVSVQLEVVPASKSEERSGCRVELQREHLVWRSCEGGAKAVTAKVVCDRRASAPLETPAALQQGVDVATASGMPQVRGLKQRPGSSSTPLSATAQLPAPAVMKAEMLEDVAWVVRITSCHNALLSPYQQAAEVVPQAWQPVLPAFAVAPENTVAFRSDTARLHGVSLELQRWLPEPEPDAGEGGPQRRHALPSVLQYEFVPYGPFRDGQLKQWRGVLVWHSRGEAGPSGGEGNGTKQVAGYVADTMELEVPVDWSQISYSENLRLGVRLTVLRMGEVVGDERASEMGAVLAEDELLASVSQGKVAVVHVFGTPEGHCPPGTHTNASGAGLAGIGGAVSAAAGGGAGAGASNAGQAVVFVEDTPWTADLAGRNGSSDAATLPAASEPGQRQHPRSASRIAAEPREPAAAGGAGEGAGAVAPEAEALRDPSLQAVYLTGLVAGSNRSLNIQLSPQFHPAQASYKGMLEWGINDISLFLTSFRPPQHVTVQGCGMPPVHMLHLPSSSIFPAAPPGAAATAASAPSGSEQPGTSQPQASRAGEVGESVGAEEAWAELLSVRNCSLPSDWAPLSIAGEGAAAASAWQLSLPLQHGGQLLHSCNLSLSVQDRLHPRQLMQRLVDMDLVECADTVSNTAALLASMQSDAAEAAAEESPVWEDLKELVNGTLDEAAFSQATQQVNYNLTLMQLTNPQHAVMRELWMVQPSGPVLLCGPQGSLPPQLAHNLVKLLHPQATEAPVPGAGPRPGSSKQPQVSLTPSCLEQQPMWVNTSGMEEGGPLMLLPRLVHPEVPGVTLHAQGAKAVHLDWNSIQPALLNASEFPAMLDDEVQEPVLVISLPQASRPAPAESAATLHTPPDMAVVDLVVTAEDNVTSQTYQLALGNLPPNMKLGAFTGSSPGVSAAGLPAGGAAAACSLPGRFCAIPKQAAASASPAGSSKLLPWPTAPADSLQCMGCLPGTYSAAIDVSLCTRCEPGNFTSSSFSTSCAPCPEGSTSRSYAAPGCWWCMEGTYAPEPGSTMCSICPEGWTTPMVGSTECNLRVGALDLQRNYAIIISFGLLLHGVSLQEIQFRTGINATAVEIITLVVRHDTADAFNISTGDVDVTDVSALSRRLLYVNVTANIGADVPDDATEEQIHTQMEVAALSADEQLAEMANNPDRFFGNTRKSLGVEVQPEGGDHKENHPHRSTARLLWPVIVFPLMAGLLALAGCSALCTLHRRKARFRCVAGYPALAAGTQSSCGSTAAATATPFGVQPASAAASWRSPGAVPTPLGGLWRSWQLRLRGPQPKLPGSFTSSGPCEVAADAVLKGGEHASNQASNMRMEMRLLNSARLRS